MTTTATLRLPVALKKRLTAAARRRGLTLSRYLIESAERATDAAPEPLPVSSTALEIMRFVRPENTRPEDL